MSTELKQYSKIRRRGMNMYTTPKEGTYSHKMPNFDGTFSVQQVKVAVLGESEKQYLIWSYCQWETTGSMTR